MEGAEKLPKWAQREIEALERRVRSAEALAREAVLSTNPDDTDTYVSPRWEEKIGLPVYFRVGDDLELQVRVEDDCMGGKYINLHGVSGRLVIEPQVSNVVRVRVVRT